MITNTCKNCGFQISYNHPCGHFEEYCPMCTLRKDYLKKGVYETINGAYCILDDNVDFNWNHDEIEEYEAYQIGYNENQIGGSYRGILYLVARFLGKGKH